MPMRKSRTSIARRAVWLAAAYVVVTAGLLAGLLYQLRREAIAARERELAAFAQLTAEHTSEVARRLEEALKVAELTLSVAAGTSAADEDSIRDMLRDVAHNARALTDVFVLDARGRIVHQASGSNEIGLDRSDRAYFSDFRGNPALTFEIGPPARRVRGSATEWFIPVAQVRRDATGGFAGVVVGTMDPQFFDRAWTFDAAISGLSIALTTADGTVIARQPHDVQLIGRRLTQSASFEQESQGRAANAFEASDSFDGRARLVAYRRIAGHPNLLAFVAQPMDLVLADWWRMTWIVGAVWLAASVALGVVGLWLMRVRRARGLLEGRYRALFDSIPYPVIVSDHESLRVLAFNHAAAAQYGWTAGAGESLLPEDLAIVAARRGEFSSEATSVLHGLKLHDRAGAAIEAELAVRLIDFDGRQAALTIVIDVSERLRAEQARQAAEEQLRQSQRMDLLGRLTGGIAHDFNNILTVIIDNVEALGEPGVTEPVLARHLNRIADATHRAEELTRQMLAFSRRQPLRPRPTDVNDLVTETGRLLRRTLGEQIEIDSVLADELWTVRVDPAQLETALVNLCVNARDAMPAGGRLLIETSNVALRADDLPAGGPPPGDYVRVAVSDTGPGIPAPELARIFEPFFTTKADGKASGLGLSMVYGFVRQSEGHIAVASEIGQGTSFKLYLPRHDAPVTAASPAPVTLPAGGAERVLVVEDDAQVRAAVVRQLTSLGYAVAHASDGTAGLAAFEAAASPYDLLLTDVVMPGGLNGKALADEIGRRWPATRVVFMSGYTDNALQHRGQIDAAVRLLNKPFRKSDLARMVRQALDASPVGA
jgi:PAS domain S-box-containing protein